MRSEDRHQHQDLSTRPVDRSGSAHGRLLLDRNLDLRLESLDRNMSAIGHLQTQDVLAGWENEGGRCRARTEVDMGRIRGHDRTGRHKGLVHNNVEVPSVLLKRAGRRDSYSLGTHRHSYRTLDCGSVQGRLEEHSACGLLGGAAAGSYEEDQEKQAEKVGHTDCGVWDDDKRRPLDGVSRGMRRPLVLVCRTHHQPRQDRTKPE
jgi:hypothetical protein